MSDKTTDYKADERFCGTATVGERGQVVIPAEIRKAMNIQPGDKLLIWRHDSGKGLMIFPVESVREFMNIMLETLKHADSAEPERQDEPKP